MDRFPSAREAKQFLISRIVEEAERENSSLSGVERKMLDFTEAESMPQDMVEASGAFDREYDQDVYEKKIARLVRKAARRARKEKEYGCWWDAIQLLQRQDHYLLVMIRAAGLRPPHDQLKLLSSGLAIVGVMFLGSLILERFNVDQSRDAFQFYLWTGAVFLVIGYVLVRWIVGAKRFDDVANKLLERLFRD
jgi:hypothetical protein